MLTRRQTRMQTQQENIPSNIAGKRKAVESPMDKVTRKRSAFGDITNALRNVRISTDDKSSLKPLKKVADTKNENIFKKSNKVGVKIIKKTAIGAKHSYKNSRSLTSLSESELQSFLSDKSSSDIKEVVTTCQTFTRIIDQEDQLKSSSLPCSQADQDQSFRSATSDLAPSLERESFKDKVQLLKPEKFALAEEINDEFTIVEDPAPDYNYDKENEMDPFNVPEFARDIFAYYLMREAQFVVTDYMCNQPTITRQMRAILVDWMVEIQESFELNHETLYQAVKMTDLYLCKKPIDKKNLQLVGTTSLFISSKFDERCPPPSEDFLYICDDAYTRKQLLEMERDMLKSLHFDIGFPISYRFLRRYAKASKLGMETLTLARYILECSMMFYECLQIKDSLIAAGCLMLALMMKKEGKWTPILEKYSGYSVTEVESIVWSLNEKMTATTPHGRSLNNIKNKYSHEVFYKVTEIPFLSSRLDITKNDLSSPDENTG